LQELRVSRTETDVIDAARSGDARTFEELVGVHMEAGYRVALAVLRDPDEARDALQEAAFKAWRRFGQLRDGRLARPWFLSIVTNQCLSVRRGRWWSVVRTADVERPSPQAEEGVAEKTDLERGLAQLPRQDRLALFLYFYLDLPMEEVGEVLGLSAAGAKTRVYRAAKKLRPGLEMS
jgi:RNA polymerase sigma-70 factor (ECF subfamily)